MDANFLTFPLFPAEIQPLFNLCHKWQTAGTTAYGLLKITSNIFVPSFI